MVFIFSRTKLDTMNVLYVETLCIEPEFFRAEAITEVRYRTESFIRCFGSSTVREMKPFEF
jgi:hypothetical protein